MTSNEESNLQDRLQQAVSFIRSKSPLKPKVGIILGSGLGNFVDDIKVETAIAYKDIPHFSPSTIEGHKGQLVLGHVGDVPVVVLQGRIHYYEGHTMDSVVFPTRTMAMLGIQNLVVTNAAGGLDPQYGAGTFMVIRDHINLMGNNPLMGPNLKTLGPRFPDMTEAYDRELVETMSRIFAEKKIAHYKGVYCAVSGPTYETPAEVRYLQIVGGNAVGMSTVPEVIAANHMGLRVAAVSCITNPAAGISKNKLSHDEVTETAKRVQSQFKDFLHTFVLTFK